MNNKIKTAVILCGGKGTRLGVLGKKKAKTLLKVHDKEILWYIINALKLNNFNHIILPLGYRGSQIKKFINSNNFGIKFDILPTGVNTPIGLRISKIVKKIQSKNFLLLNGDAIFDINLNKYFSSHNQNMFDVTFLSGEIIYPYGTIGLRNNKICDFKRNIVYDGIKLRNKKNYTAFNYTGMSIISKKVIKKYLPHFKGSKNFEQSFFSKVIASSKCKLIKIKGFWHSIDNIKDLDAVNIKRDNLKNYSTVAKLKKILNKLN